MASKSGGCVRRERMAKDEKWNLYGTLLHVFVRPVSQSVSQSVGSCHQQTPQRSMSPLHSIKAIFCSHLFFVCLHVPTFA